MNRLITGALVAAALALHGCGEPLPAGKLAYAGDWRAGGVALSISEAGHVEYQRVKGAVTTSVSGPLQRFEGDSFVVGVSFMTTRFEVSRAPYEDAGRWKMVVDGVELTKVR